jgi:hypothetical protein
LRNAAQTGWNFDLQTLASDPLSKNWTKMYLDVNTVIHSIEQNTLRITSASAAPSMRLSDLIGGCFDLVFQTLVLIPAG